MGAICYTLHIATEKKYICENIMYGDVLKMLSVHVLLILQMTLHMSLK